MLRLFDTSFRKSTKSRFLKSEKNVKYVFSHTICHNAVRERRSWDQFTCCEGTCRRSERRRRRALTAARWTRPLTSSTWSLRCTDQSHNTWSSRLPCTRPYSCDSDWSRSDLPAAFGTRASPHTQQDIQLKQLSRVPHFCLYAISLVSVRADGDSPPPCSDARCRACMARDFS